MCDKKTLDTCLGGSSTKLSTMLCLRTALRVARNHMTVRTYCIAEDNPYFAKYASKLKKYKEANPEEFEDKLKDLKKNQRKKVLVNPDGTVEDGVTPKGSFRSVFLRFSNLINIDKKSIVDERSS